MLHYTTRQLLVALAATALLLPCAASPAGQKPLTTWADSSPLLHSFTNVEQSADLCDAGSKFWTGSVQISPEKSMFYWYFESRDDPKNDPVLLWMSGGPGATGEFGLLKETGPCGVNPDGNSTFRREHSWTNHANVLFIDQPIGVGFSTITNRDLMSVNLLDGAKDLYAFLSIFTSSAHPETAKKPWSITGESMGGHYVTAYTQYIVQQQRERAEQSDVLDIDVKTAIIIDGYIDNTRSIAGYYDFLCLDWRGNGSVPLFGRETCEAMEAGVAKCEAEGARCRETYDIDVCTEADTRCNEAMGHYFWDDVKEGGLDPYDARHQCDEPPLCTDLQGGPTHEFLNQPWVQQRLGFNKSIPFDLIDMDANKRWEEDGHVMLPATRELTWLLDETDVRILFINGNEDIIINSPGQIRMLDQHSWKGQAGYQAQEFEKWYYRQGKLVQGTIREEGTAVKGGSRKGTERLSLVLVDEAGHMAPADQAEGVGAIVRAWIQSVDVYFR